MAELFKFLSGWRNINASEPVNFPVKFIENGDGTYSERINFVTGGLPPTDASGSITIGGTAQEMIAADATGYRFSIRNHHASESLWFNELGDTAIVGQPSQEIPAKGYYETPAGMLVVSAVSIIGATTGQSFTARKW